LIWIIDSYASFHLVFSWWLFLHQYHHFGRRLRSLCTFAYASIMVLIFFLCFPTPLLSWKDREIDQYASWMFYIFGLVIWLFEAQTFEIYYILWVVEFLYFLKGNNEFLFSKVLTSFFVMKLFSLIFSNLMLIVLDLTFCMILALFWSYFHL
jgi:hypothetical protein